MCGIAGFSLSPDSPVDRTLAAQALLAGIAERGADAVGYAHRVLTARSQRDEAPRRSERSSRRAVRPVADQRQRSSTSATSRRGTPRSRRTTTRSGTASVVGHPQRHHRERRRTARPLRHRARRAADDRRLGGDLRAHGASADTIRARSPSCAARWRRRGSTSATARRSTSRAGVFARSGSAGPPRASTSRRRAVRSRSPPPR